MYRYVNIYEPADPEDLEELLEKVKRAASELTNCIHWETGFRMDDGRVCLILDFATRTDCLYWPQSKEYIALHHEMPALLNETCIDYWTEDQ